MRIQTNLNLYTDPVILHCTWTICLKADKYIHLSQHIHAIKIKLLYGYRETMVGTNKISPKALDKGKLLDKKITLECLKSMC